MPRLPLSVALAAQLFVVIAAFVAAITVLSVQQRDEFESSLFTHLRKQHAASLYAIVAPILERATVFDRFVDAYTNGRRVSNQSQNHQRFVAPADEPHMTTLERAQEFYDHFYILTVNDPLVSMTSVANLSSTRWDPYHEAIAARNININEGAGGVLLASGERVVPRSWLLNRTSIWNLWVADRTRLISVQNETATVCYSAKGYPTINFPCAAPAVTLTNLSTNTAVMIGSAVEMQRRPHVWGRPQILGPVTSIIAYNRQFFHDDTASSLSSSSHTSESHVVTFSVSFSLPHIYPLLKNNSAHGSASRSALFSEFYRVALGQRYDYFVTGIVDFPLWAAPEVVNVTGDTLDGAWIGGETPDPILNAAYWLAMERLEANATDSLAVEMVVGGASYIASAARHADPLRNFNWLYVEYTPRTVFFERSDRARAVGIIIGVAGALGVLAVCVLIWLAVKIPLQRLVDTMGLAADRRYEEARDFYSYSNGDCGEDGAGSSRGGGFNCRGRCGGSSGAPLLRELFDVELAFIAMNEKLIAARPFLPKGLISPSYYSPSCSSSGARDSVSDGDWGDGEEQLRHNATANGDRARIRCYAQREADVPHRFRRRKSNGRREENATGRSALHAHHRAGSSGRVSTPDRPTADQPTAKAFDELGV